MLRPWRPLPLPRAQDGGREADGVVHGEVVLAYLHVRLLSIGLLASESFAINTHYNVCISWLAFCQFALVHVCLQ